MSNASGPQPPQAQPGYAKTTAGSASPQETDAPLTTVTQAQDALARATRQLDDALAARGAATKPEDALAPKPAQPSTAGTSAGTAPTSPTSPTVAPSPTAPSPCATGCKALTSMQRAAESICRMTNDTDDRCLSARKKVTESTAKLTSCGCQ